LKKELQGYPVIATQIGKKIPVTEKISAQDFRDAEDHVSVGNLPEQVGTEPFPEFHPPLPMAGSLRGLQPQLLRPLIDWQVLQGLAHGPLIVSISVELVDKLLITEIDQ
jgi:hypothetical protein